MSRRTKRAKPWTETEVRAFGVRMDGVTACEIVYDVGRTRAYELLNNGDVDVPVIRRGRNFVVPTSAVLSLLGLADAPPEATDRRALRAVPPPREVA